MLNLSRSVSEEFDETLLTKLSRNRARRDEELIGLLKSVQKQLNSLPG